MSSRLKNASSSEESIERGRNYRKPRRRSSSRSASRSRSRSRERNSRRDASYHRNSDYGSSRRYYRDLNDRDRRSRSPEKYSSRHSRRQSRSRSNDRVRKHRSRSIDNKHRISKTKVDEKCNTSGSSNNPISNDNNKLEIKSVPMNDRDSSTNTKTLLDDSKTINEPAIATMNVDNTAIANAIPTSSTSSSSIINEINKKLLIKLKYATADMIDEQIMNEKIQLKLKQELELYNFDTV